MKSFLVSVCALLLLVASSLSAQEAGEPEPLGTRYVSDRFHVPLRAGPGTQYRVVHRGLVSGTELELLQVDEEAGYSLVRTSRGLEGWLETHLLSETPVAAARLAQARQAIENLRNERDALREELREATGSSETAREQLEAVRAENEQLKEELDEIKRVSADAIQLDQDNRALSEANEQLRDRVDVLEAENERLSENRENQAFINGAIAVVVGVIIALVVPRLRPKKRSEWI